MVLKTYQKGGLSALAVTLACSPSTLYAQYVGQTAPSLRVTDPEYTSEGVNLGPVKVFSDIDFELTYDDNVFAESTGENSDLALTVEPRTELRYQSGGTNIRGLAAVSYRRFADFSSENSTGAVVEGEVVSQPSVGDTFTVFGGWIRGVEDRGDPEARDATDSGPRLSDIYTGRLGYSRQKGQISFKIDGEVRKYDNVADVDAERDLISYGARSTIGYRISGNVFAVASGFLIKRDFRIPVNVFGVNRNATTYGGQLGVQIDPGGVVEGNASAGIFRLDSAGTPQPLSNGTTVDPDYSGLSVDASLTYRPRQRTAITFTAFRGDVATFRLGSVARTDTQINVGVQQEVRHNIYASASAFYRKSNFRGAVVGGQTARSLPEKIVGLQGELEYLVNRNTALAVKARYTTRDSADVAEEYSRFRGGVELRFNF